jgi:hypothetical protein
MTALLTSWLRAKVKIATPNAPACGRIRTSAGMFASIGSRFGNGRHFCTAALQVTLNQMPLCLEISSCNGFLLLNLWFSAVWNDERSAHADPDRASLEAVKRSFDLFDIKSTIRPILRFHSLRHPFVSELANADIPVRMCAVRLAATVTRRFTNGTRISIFNLKSARSQSCGPVIGNRSRN